jgi:histidine ammonia-lyase
MLNAARRLALRGDWRALAAKISNAPHADDPARAQFEQEVRALMQALVDIDAFHPGAAVAQAHAKIRAHIAFMSRDRAMDGEVRAICELVAQGGLTA